MARNSSHTYGSDIDADDVFGPVNLTGTPERNLLMAILVRAILDLVGNDKKEADAAEEWLFDFSDNLKNDCLKNGSQTNEPYSFPWICAELDLDLESVVAKIRAMPKRGANRVAPWYFTKKEGTRFGSAPERLSLVA